MIVSICPQNYYESRLLPKMGDLANRRIFENCHFLEKMGKGQFIIFPKNVNFQSSSFSHHDSPNIPSEGNAFRFIAKIEVDPF